MKYVSGVGVLSVLGVTLAVACSNTPPPDSPGTGGSDDSGDSGGGDGNGESGATSTGGKSSSGGSSSSGSGGGSFQEPIVDEEGWTVLEIADGAKTIYVSTSDGSDDNSGESEDDPVATIAKGIGFLEDGDWLLLKRGDTFQEGIRAWVNGSSTEHRSVIGAYGPLEDPRPIIDPGGGPGILMQGGGEKDTLEHVALVSLHIRQSQSIVGDGNYSAQRDSDGIRVLRPGEDLLIEDCMIESFSTDFSIQGEGDGFFNLTIRRSEIIDAYESPDGEHSQGIYLSQTHYALIEENIIDHNGFNDDTGAEKTIFNHNVYIQGDSPNPTVLNNIIARGSSNGYQLRSAGRAEGNILIENSIAGFVANGTVQDDTVMIQKNNVVVHPWIEALGDMGARGWGLALVYDSKYVFPTEPVDFTGNIIAHGESPASNAIDVPNDYATVTVDLDNIVYDWGNSADEGGPFSDPDRTIPSYNESLGGDASIEAFLEAARQMRKGYWNEDYTAEKVRAYFVEGFSE